jgi:D-aspartate ligase
MPLQYLSSGALVLGGAHGALAVVRSLGRQGIPVWLISNGQTLAKFSRYTSRSFPWPGPEHPEALGWLLNLAREHQLYGWTLFPAADADARLVSLQHAELSKVFRLTTPPWDVTQWAFDKRLTYQRAASLGIDVPWSYYPRGRQDVAQFECHFPLILKPTMRQGENAFTAAKAWKVDGRDALLSRYDEAATLVGNGAIVIQELIPGSGSTQFSYAGVWNRGEPVASLVASRVRQFPIDFGWTSTYVQTIENKEVEDAACRLLRSLNYDGLVEIEFKYDQRDACYKILDINVRAWTWIALGDITGTDFPLLTWRLARGESVPSSAGIPGARWMHLSRDVVAACQEMIAGTLSPVDYVRSLQAPLTFAAFANDDVVPGILDIPVGTWRVLARRLSSMGRVISQKAPDRPVLHNHAEGAGSDGYKTNAPLDVAQLDDAELSARMAQLDAEISALKQLIESPQNNDSKTKAA